MPTGYRQPPPRAPRGFTLLELVLVMLMLTLMLALAVPSARGFLAGSRSRDAAAQLVAVTQWARARAAAEARVYRLNVDPVSGSYRVTAQDGEAFVSVGGDDFGRVFTLPEGMRLSVDAAAYGITPSGGGGDGIDFHPDGRTDTVLLRLSDASGGQTLIACLSPAESFRVVSAEEASRP